MEPFLDVQTAHYFRATAQSNRQRTVLTSLLFQDDGPSGVISRVSLHTRKCDRGEPMGQQMGELITRQQSWLQTRCEKRVLADSRQLL